MASLDQLDPKVQKIMAINISKSGSGKTGALGSLANSGYRLIIQDWDSGCQILSDPSVVLPEFRKNVFLHSLTDTYGPSTQIARDKISYFTTVGIIGAPTAFQNGMKLLSHWKTKTEDLGPMSSWGPETIFVCDTLTFLSRSAMNLVQQMNGRLNEHPSQNEWGVAMGMIENYLALLQSSQIKCHIIVNAHITYIDTPGEDKKFESSGQGKIDITPKTAYPFTLGNKLPPKVQTYFNLGLAMSGNLNKQIEVTGTHDGIVTKNPMPGKLKAPFPIKTGLAAIFRIITGSDAPSIPADQTPK